MRFEKVLTTLCFFLLLAKAGNALAGEPKEYIAVPPTIVCYEPEPLVEAQRIYMSDGYRAAMRFMKKKQRAGDCVTYAGPAKPTGKVFATWEHEGRVFLLLELKAKGTTVYTVVNKEKEGIST